MTLIQRVENIVSEIQKTHKYSMSQIYGIYNEVFATSETPQSCASCLIRKVNQLKLWLADQPKENLSTIKKAKKKKTTSI